MAIADCNGLPIAVRVTSASPHESKLVEDTLLHRHVAACPERMIGDRAYDSDALDQRLRREHGSRPTAGISASAPRMAGHSGVICGVGTFAWLKNFRRLSSRWERYAVNFLGMVQLGCALILLRHL